MLKLSFAALARGEARVQEAIPADDPLWEDTGLPLAGPVEVELVGSRVGEGVLVRGTVRAPLAMECRRCLTPVQQVVEDSVDLLFEPLDAAEEEELGGEVYPLPARGDELELGPALREELLLRVPTLVVCDEACRGLCPQCGADLNRTTCACVPDEPTGPWDALKNVKFD